MELSIVKIGNSKGIRLPKALIDKYGLNHKVEVMLEKDHMILKPVRSPRKGWESAFKKMSRNGDDRLLFNEILNNRLRE